MLNLPEILKIFRKGYKPKEEEFRETWRSFWHKSERLPQTQVLGLLDVLGNKVDREDLKNLNVGIKDYHNDVQTTAERDAIVNPYEGLAVVVIEDKDENGNSYIHLYNGTSWKKTPMTVLPKNVATLPEIVDKSSYINRLFLLKEGAPAIDVNSPQSEFWMSVLDIKIHLKNKEAEKYIYDIAYFNNTNTEGFAYAFQISRRLPTDNGSGALGTVQNTEWNGLTGIQICKATIWGNVDIEIVIDLSKLKPKVYYISNGNKPEEHAIYTGYSYINPIKYYVGDDSKADLTYVNTETSLKTDKVLYINRLFLLDSGAPAIEANSPQSEFWLSVLDVRITLKNELAKNYVYDIGYFNNSNLADFEYMFQIIRRKPNDTSVWGVSRYDLKNPNWNGLTGIQIAKGVDLFGGLIDIEIVIDLSKLKPKIYYISNETNLSPFRGFSYINPTRYMQMVTSSFDVSGLQFVKVDGENLYISYKHTKDKDLTIWFKKCMFNELYTFYRVGLVSNLSPIPTNSPELADTILNQTFSDNIAPIGTDEGWVGGNHSYKEDKKTKTARTVSFKIKADNIELKYGDSIYAKKVEISVVNEIFNPYTAITDNESGVTTLPDVLCDEIVTYTVENGNIQPSVSHVWKSADNVAITTYYGMQSMFVNEVEIMTPRGAYPTFTPEANVTDFRKGDYPNFNRFIERLEAGYQSSYLLPAGLGKHEEIKDTDSIFIRSGNKTYHRIIASRTRKAGDVDYWSGVYTWFANPIQDDANVLVYDAVVSGKNTIFIDVKQAFEGFIQLPEKYVMRGFKVEKDNSISICEDIIPIGLYVNAIDKGSIILSIE